MLCSTIIPTVIRPSLKRAVMSALEQGLDPEQHEIILVNDSGNPLPKANWLKSESVKIENTYHCERSVARNVGAAIASGKYLHFLDDDDYLLPGGLRALLDVAETSECDWIYGAHNRVDNEGNFMSLNRPPIRGNIFGLLLAGESIHLCPSLIKRDAFLRIGGFDPLLTTIEDRDLQSRIALTSDFERTDYVIGNVRIGPGGESTTDWSNAKQDNRTVREKLLNAPEALLRLLDSVQGNVHLRGRCCRAYLLSGFLNLKSGQIFIALSRFFSVFGLAGFYPLLPEFWRGLFYITYWHSVEKQREIEHFSKHVHS